MKMHFPSLMFSLICIGTLQANIQEHPFHPNPDQTCMTGWVKTTTQMTETNQCIKVSNCAEDSLFDVQNADCPSLLDNSSCIEASGKLSVALQFKTGGKEYFVPPVENPSAENQTPSWSMTQQLYHLLGYVLHSYEIINKSYQISKQGLTPHHMQYMTYYLVGAVIHTMKTPLLQLISDISYMAPGIFYAGMAFASGIAYWNDCNCGDGGCCHRRTTFQKIYRYINPHTIMMLMYSAASLGFR